MKINAWVPCLLLIACLSLIACTSSPEPPTAPAVPKGPPNILFLFTDDHSTAAISAYGSRINRTPNIDRLAKEGMLFDSVFCTNSICAPSRAVILTGKHSEANGVRDNRDRFDGDQPTFPKDLQAAGYQTAMIGKWHLKSDPTGFDYWDVLPGQGHYYQPDFRNAEGTRRIEGYATDITTDLALEWLESGRDPEKPFLLMCQHKAPHRTWMPGPDHLDLYDDVTIPEPPTLFDDYVGRTDAAREQEMEIDRHMYMHYDLMVPPLETDPEPKGPDKFAAGLINRLTPEQRVAWDAAFDSENAAFRAAELTGRELVSWKYQRYIKNYLRCIASVDDNIGRMLDYLDRSGLAENTIVVYSSDQGFFLGEHGWYDKRFMYEPSLRMPFVVRWPGVVQAGKRNSQLAQNVDFAPTFLEAAGVERPGYLQGHSLVPWLRGETPSEWRDSVYYEYYERGAHNVQPHRGLRGERYKLIHFHELDQWEFYDLREDPDELRNSIDEARVASIVEEMKRDLERQRQLYAPGEVD